MFLLAGCDENPGIEAVSNRRKRQNCPAAIGKNMALSISSKQLGSQSLDFKIYDDSENFLTTSGFFIALVI
jgi:hypothetical protein